jgi:hypothetical protein
MMSNGKTKRFSVKCARCKQAWVAVLVDDLSAFITAQSNHIAVCAKPLPAWATPKRVHELFSLVRFQEVKGTLNPEVECGDKCLSATGPSCSCSCGGACHGASACDPDNHPKAA